MKKKIKNATLRFQVVKLQWNKIVMAPALFLTSGLWCGYKTLQHLVHTTIHHFTIAQNLNNCLSVCSDMYKMSREKGQSSRRLTLTTKTPPKLERKYIEKNRRNHLKTLYTHLFSLLPTHLPQVFYVFCLD